MVGGDVTDDGGEHETEHETGCGSWWPSTFSCIDVVGILPELCFVVALVIAAIILVDKIFEHLREASEASRFWKVFVKAMEQELVVLGTLSFALFACTASRKGGNEPLMELIEFVHMILFVMAVVYYSLIGVMGKLCAQRLRQLGRLEQEGGATAKSISELMSDYKAANRTSRHRFLLTHRETTTLRVARFLLCRSVFIIYHELDERFSYTEYVSRLAEETFIKLLKIGSRYLIALIFVMLVVGAIAGATSEGPFLDFSGRGVENKMFGDDKWINYYVMCTLYIGVWMTVMLWAAILRGCLRLQGGWIHTLLSEVALRVGNRNTAVYGELDAGEENEEQSDMSGPKRDTAPGTLNEALLSRPSSRSGARKQMTEGGGTYREEARGARQVVMDMHDLFLPSDLERYKKHFPCGVPGLMVPLVKTTLLTISLYVALIVIVFIHSPVFVSLDVWYLWATPPLWLFSLGKFGTVTYIMHRYAGPCYSKEALDAASDEHQDQERSAVGSDLDGATMNYAIITEGFMCKEAEFLLR